MHRVQLVINYKPHQKNVEALAQKLTYDEERKINMLRGL